LGFGIWSLKIVSFTRRFFLPQSTLRRHRDSQRLYS